MKKALALFALAVAGACGAIAGEMTNRTMWSDVVSTNGTIIVSGQNGTGEAGNKLFD